MIKTNNSYISKLSLQRVGNKHRNELSFFTDSELSIDKEEEVLLKRFFLSSLRSEDELMKFTHHIELSYNLVYDNVKQFFDGSLDFIELSRKTLHHLYEKSDHAQIKSGEVFTVFFENIMFEEITTQAIGIFKVERKLDYLHFAADEEDNMFFELRKGTKPQKIDKGCLILNTHADDGFRVYSFDNNSYDTIYWKNSFLNLDFVVNESYQTKHHLDLLVKFSETLVEENNSFVQKDFITQGVKMLNENEFVSKKMIEEELLEPFEVVESYDDFKKTYRDDYEIELEEDFFVAHETLKKAQRKIKSEIKLDTKISIKIDLKEADSVVDNIEKGYDEERGMSFYKVFFNEEE
ncbi:MAG: nucleoid-associated protein [Flavobacteriales bacterium]|jgi:hypothetical protein|nr:nucleoid-associated protein [Flavobacteriales bacterium]